MKVVIMCVIFSFFMLGECVEYTEFSFILKPSSVDGIGVFATHDIPAGTQVMTSLFKPRQAKIKDIPPAFRKFIIYLNDEDCLCPEHFDRMAIGWYLNHSDTPNIAKDENDRVFAIKDIKEGDEILCDYNQFDEPDHLKDSFFKP